MNTFKILIMAALVGIEESPELDAMILEEPLLGQDASGLLKAILKLHAGAGILAAANCALQGFRLENGLMIGISVVGLTAAVLNTRFILSDDPPLNEWLIQHTRGLVGAGISVYTAFLAFGAVNLLPAYAFNPVVWATPCTLGIGLLLYHQYRITLQRRRLAVRQVPSGP